MTPAAKVPVDVRLGDLEALVARLDRYGKQSRKKMEDRLRELESRIETLERALSDPPGPKFYESGTIHPELDDPAIAPP